MIVQRTNIIPIISIMAVACSDPFAAEAVRFYRAVATGGEHTCAVATDGSAWCWGRGLEGQLGIGVKENRDTPARVSGTASFTAITAGVAHTCGLANDGAVYCWGWNAFYERGNATDSRDDVPVPVETPTRFRALSAGANHTCALSLDSLAYCWGANQYGQLGDGTVRTRAQPQRASGNTKFVDITAGGGHSCALTVAGEAWCWGRNDIAQLGRGSVSAFSSTPALVNTPIRFRQIDAGLEHTCAVALDTRFFCWGGGVYGELGTGGATPKPHPDSPVPVTISPLFPAGLQISAGEHHTCAIGYELRCWGLGTEGQLGIGVNTTNFHPQPVHLHFRDTFVPTIVATGGNTHACALSDQRVYCWGTGEFGQLGVAGVTYVSLPQRVEN
jgi:alpha-tubulin suppressor-like RCC1 family protein